MEVVVTITEVTITVVTITVGTITQVTIRESITMKVNKMVVKVGDLTNMVSSISYWLIVGDVFLRLVIVRH